MISAFILSIALNSQKRDEHIEVVTKSFSSDATPQIESKKTIVTTKPNIVIVKKNLVEEKIEMPEIIKSKKREIRLQRLKNEIYLRNYCTNTNIDATYAYYNKLRIDSGMTALKRNNVLERSANNHAKYLYENFDYIPHDLSMHLEDYSMLFFTGQKPYERALSEGYFAKTVSEGIAFAYTAKQSLDGLMTAIYHRFGILDFDIDEVGVSNYLMTNNCMFSFVHNPSISIVNDLCQQDLNTSMDELAICKEDKGISRSLYRDTLDAINKKNPPYVLYPPNNSTNIIRAFYGEIPDPMPDKEFTANPVSIQFNPYFYKNHSIEMSSFTIREVEKKEFLDARIINQKNDPNHHFNRYEFALFAFNIFDFSQNYIVEFKYRIDNKEQEPIIWRFSTGYKTNYREF